MQLKPFELERWFGLYEFTAKHNLADSAIQPLTSDELAEISGRSLIEIFAGLDLGYRESNGSLPLRSAISMLYPNTDEREVLVTIGAIEANFLALRQLVKPGQRVIVQHPIYQQLTELPLALGAKVEPWGIVPGVDHRSMLDELKELLTRPADYLVIANPHNPTGVAFSGTELRAISELATQAGCRLYADEVYRGLGATASTVIPSMREIDPNAIVIGSMSKAYGLAGLRIGWVVADSKTITGCWEERDYTSICPPAVSERLALVALEHREQLLERAAAIIDRNLVIARDYMGRLSHVIDWIEPEAGAIAFPSFSGHLARPLCERLVNEVGVLLVPGDVFGCPNNFRMGLGISTERLSNGLHAMEKWIKES